MFLYGRVECVMREIVMYMILGYLSGSVLFARVFARVFRKEGMLENSRDRNPGTANAFMYGGFWCGALTLAGDLLKGFLPVFLFLQSGAPEHAHALLSGLVIAAPVIGHGFPVFFGFQGGKGIAVSFGCLLGMIPLWKPLAFLALFFIFFSVVFRITPHYYRTLAAYLCTLAVILGMGGGDAVRAVKAGFFVITLTVCVRLLVSKEAKEKMGVKLLWMR